jgi:hypothetical protein
MNECDPPAHIEIIGDANVVGDENRVTLIQRQADEETLRELAELRARLIEALAAIRETNVFLRDLALEVRDLSWRVRALEAAIGLPAPIELLREAARLLTDHLAPLLLGAPLKELKQQILAQASKLPIAAHLDVVTLEAGADDLARLNDEVRVLLEAYQYTEEPGILDALAERGAALAAYVLQITGLGLDEAPGLAQLAAQVEA